MTTLDDHLRAQHEAATTQAQAREKRRKIVRSVAHSSAMEGMPLDAATLTLFEGYIDGPLTTAQLRETVLKQYRR
ncbi:antitoxin VbhA family protein [Deinococcus sp.]|uniref:antitoxin VbhA family protein n=1 Tax=Deinococcus sp. TaxID=47478 RepID=UPI003B5AED86